MTMGKNRARQAVVLRDQGWTLAQIGAALGVCAERARQLIYKGRKVQ